MTILNPTVLTPTRMKFSSLNSLAVVSIDFTGLIMDVFLEICTKKKKNTKFNRRKCWSTDTRCTYRVRVGPQQKMLNDQQNRQCELVSATVWQQAFFDVTLRRIVAESDQPDLSRKSTSLLLTTCPRVIEPPKRCISLRLIYYCFKRIQFFFFFFSKQTIESDRFGGSGSQTVRRGALRAPRSLSRGTAAHTKLKISFRFLFMSLVVFHSRAPRLNSIQKRPPPLEKKFDNLAIP